MPTLYLVYISIGMEIVIDVGKQSHLTTFPCVNSWPYTPTL